MELWGDGVLSVASYNVHRCRGGDARHDPDRVAHVLKQIDADVIGLQEVDSHEGAERGLDQLDYLARCAGYASVPGPLLLRHVGSTGNGLLTRLPVLEVRRHDLSYPGREPRGAIDVDLAAGDARIRVIVTHLGLRMRERRDQALRLLRAAPPIHEVEILLGDFNEWRAAARAVRCLHDRFGHGRTVRTFPAWWPILPLDRIWVSPADRLVEVTAIDGPVARRASDHLPVRGVISLRPL
jgi:endonuclease/exonuclease/phosphatase family metal-dependent hydrolase